MRFWHNRRFTGAAAAILVNRCGGRRPGELLVRRLRDMGGKDDKMESPFLSCESSGMDH
jgi:hypothetical protein